jgi:tetratricopeptide (TPR) repeat protein
MSRLSVSLLWLVVACGPKPTTTTPAAEQGPIADGPAADAGEEAGVVDGASTPESAEQPMHEAVNEAVALLAADADAASIQRAVGMLERAVDRDPRNAYARLNLGVARHRAGDLDGAMREYQAAVGQDAKVGRAWLHMGLIQLDNGRLDAAESNFLSGIRNDPDEPALRVALIDLLREAGRREEAVIVSKEALKLHANSVDIYNSLGLTYLAQDQLLLARFVYQKALIGIAGAEQNAQLHLNMGWTYYLEDNPGRAVLEFEKALELDPWLVPALVKLSRVHMDNRNYVDTVPLLERAAERAPDDSGVAMELGIAYRGTGRFNEAERQYRKVLKLSPNDPSPWLNLGILFGDYTKDYNASLEAFDTYLSEGGTLLDQVADYQKLVKREQKRVERQKQADTERAEREAQRAERERLVKETDATKALEAAANPPGPDPGEGDAPSVDASAEDAPAVEGAPTEGANEAPQDPPAEAPDDKADEAGEGQGSSSGDSADEGTEAKEPQADEASAGSPWGEPE